MLLTKLSDNIPAEVPEEYIDKHDVARRQTHFTTTSISNRIGIALTSSCGVMNVRSYLFILQFQSQCIPDSKVHWANPGPIWGRQDQGGPMLAQRTMLSGIALKL